MNRLTLFVVVTITLSCPRAALSGSTDCADWTAGPLTAFPQGVQGQVLTSIEFDHDNLPLTPPWLVVGGEFVSAGGVLANNVAAWDGQIWRAMNNGMTHTSSTASVRALAIFNNQLYAGGLFNRTGTVTLPGNMAVWNGTSWQPVGNPAGSLQGVVNCMAVFQNRLVCAGMLNSPVTTIARAWNGTDWFTTGSGTNGHIFAMAVHNGLLYAGGTFTTVNGIPAQLFARYNGSSWSGIAFNHINGLSVDAMVVNPADGTLIVGGHFNTAGGVSVHNIARFNGSNFDVFSAVGNGNDPTTGVTALGTTPYSHLQVIVAGKLNSGGPNPVNIIQAVDSQDRWSVLGNTPSCTIKSIGYYQGDPSFLGDEKIIVGGSLGLLDGTNASGVAQRRATDGQFGSEPKWLPIHNAGAARAISFSYYGVAVGGDFTYPIATGIADHILQWNGSQILPLPDFHLSSGGVNGSVYAMRGVFVSQFPANQFFVYAGGYFSMAGVDPVNRIASHRTTDDVIKPTFSWGPMGNGLNDGVFAIEQHNGEIYAGGNFTQGGTGGAALNHVARWNGTSWQPVASGLTGIVFALKSFGGQLYAGGSFAFTGTGQSAARIARWNGTTWSPIGIGMNNNVFALAIDNGTLVAGGAFTLANGVQANGVARLSGNTFTAVGRGLQGTVNCLASNGTRLYAGGQLNAPGFGAQSVVVLNPSTGFWFAPDIDLPPDGRVYGLHFYNDELHAVGEFHSLGGAIDSPVWARLKDYTNPLILTQPQNVTVTCGDTANFSFVLHSSYAGHYTFRWHRNGVALNNGPGPDGSFIAGATGQGLMISSASSQNIGTYTCKATPMCSSLAITSASATLGVNNCCAPDINNNGAANVDDLLAVINAWGVCPAPPAFCPADIAPPGGNGAVGVDDLLAVINGWGMCP